MMVHAFLYDTSFVNPSSILDPVNKTGGVAVLSPTGLSYFVTPEEFIDPRTLRIPNLNTPLTGKPRLIIDQGQFAGVLSDIETVWSATEQQNLFAIIDQLCFALNAGDSPSQVETAVSVWPQYVPATYVFSNTQTAATAYSAGNPVSVTYPDYLTFSFRIANSTIYQFRIWINNAALCQNYPLSTIRVVVPPLPLSELYTLSIVDSTANVFTTALQSAGTSQQALQSYIQAGEYTGYLGQNVVFVDANGNTTQVEFNILYNGAAPSFIAIRTAIRNLLLNSEVGTPDGWRARAPSLFVTELFYLLPMFEATTSLINSIIYPNITLVSQATADALAVLHDEPSAFVTANLAILAAVYNGLTVLGVPDSENDANRLSLLNEHPTYRDVDGISPEFATMGYNTQNFATLLSYALSAASGNAVNNSGLTPYTPPGDGRSYITFSVADVEYWVITKASYLALVPVP